MKSTFTSWCMACGLAVCLAGSAFGATIKESYLLAPSGEKGTFDATPTVVRSFVENGKTDQKVTLAFMAFPEEQRHIVSMYVYIAKSVLQRGKYSYHDPIVANGRPEKPGVEAWAFPQDGDRPLVIDLSNQIVAMPAKIDVYVIEKDDQGNSYSTLVETHYAALHAGLINAR